MGNEKSGQSRRPAKREAVKVPSPLLRKARMLAASKGVPVQDYLEQALRPVLERDYVRIFDAGEQGAGAP
jgi:hypothetical protein